MILGTRFYHDQGNNTLHLIMKNVQSLILLCIFTFTCEIVIVPYVIKNKLFHI